MIKSPTKHKGEIASRANMIRFESDVLDRVVSKQIQEIRQHRQEITDAIIDIRQIHNKYDSAQKELKEKMHI